MGSKVNTISTGGGAATGVANDFNNYLAQGLNNGSYGAVGQTQGIGNALNTLLAGGNNGSNLGDINSLLSRFAQTPNYSAPTVSGFNPSSATFGGVNFGAGLGASSPQFSTPGTVSGVNYSLPGGGVDLSSIVSQIGMRNLLPSLGTSSPGANQNVNTSGASNTPEFDAISKILGNQFTKDLGDIRERYGVSSAGLSAENAYRAQAIPQLSQALSQSATQQRQLGQTDVGLGLQGTGLNLQSMLANLSAGTEQRGQDINSLLTGRQQDIASGSLASSNSLQSIQNLLAQRGQDVTQTGLGVEQRGQDVNAAQSNLAAMLQSRGMDISQLGAISQMLLGQGGLNQQGQQYNAQNFLGGQGLLNQYMSSYGNLGLGAGQLNLGGQQLGQQGILGALSQLFNSYNDANRIGTPQAQTQVYTQPSAFQNFLGGIQGITGALKGIGNLFNPFSSGGSQQAPIPGYLMGGNTPQAPGAGIDMGSLQQMMQMMMATRLPGGGISL